MTYEPGTVADAGGETAGWTVVVPVKLLRTAKTRLAPLPDDDRAALALAMALDTVSAALACAVVDHVVVVTDDPLARSAVSELEALVVPDEPGAGLDVALAHGAAEATQRWPEAGVAAVSSDLPALRASELDLALTEASAVTRAVVADSAGAGTVLLAAVAGTALQPAYGAGSLARHRASGAVEVGASARGLRRDVDTVADLRAALGLGCGPRTTALAASLGIGRVVAATAREFDLETRAGSVVLDDGTAIAYDADALDGGLRMLRSGQRVRVEVLDSDGGMRVARIAIPTMPFADESSGDTT